MPLFVLILSKYVCYYTVLIWLICGKVLADGNIPDSKVHRDNMGPIWGREDPGGPHVGPMNFAIWDVMLPYPHQKRWLLPLL